MAFIIVCEKDFESPDPVIAPSIPTRELAEAELKCIEGRPGTMMRCFEPHIIVEIYDREEGV